MAMEKLCLFCVHFKWSPERMSGMGSPQTGPMFDGGDAQCAKGHYTSDDNTPYDEAEYRRIILRAENCVDYEQVDMS